MGLGLSISYEIIRDLGGDMALRIEYAERIPRTASGKHRFVISHCR